MATKRNKPRRKRDSIGKELRDQSIISESMAGKTTNEIADQFGLSRTAVSRALNGEGARELLELGRARVQLMMTKGLDTLEFMMDNKHEFGMAGSAFQSAKIILKSLGIVKESVDLNHQFPKPTVIEFEDGKKTIIGSEHDLREEDSGEDQDQ